MSAPLQIYSWDEQGFRGFVSHRGWLVALMNWEQRFDPNGIGPIERHNQTDEVFVLLRGQAVIFVIEEDGAPTRGVHAVSMQPGLIYNVPRATWHSVIGTRDATWLIVESNDTSRENSDYRQLTVQERADLDIQLPEWAMGKF
jgi:mannose-6-phosphate isomerase-like protein (cupin superfamily)